MSKVVTVRTIDNHEELYNTSGRPLICLRVPDGEDPKAFQSLIERMLDKAGFRAIDYFDAGSPGGVL
jgi:hypothetical protein